MINVTCEHHGSMSLSVNIKAIDSTIANKSADYSWSGSITDSSMTYDVADWADSTDAIYFTTSGTLSTSFKTIFQYDMYEIENYNITILKCLYILSQVRISRTLTLFLPPHLLWIVFLLWWCHKDLS